MFFYRNGNCIVGISRKNGTMIRYSKDDYLDCNFPDSMDIKITNMCFNNCPMCHEKSCSEGKHGDILSPCFIDKLHPYTQLAIGGGNVLLHPDLIKFLQKCKSLKLIPSITVAQKDFENNFDFINQLYKEHLIYGIGVSLEKITENFLQKINTIPSVVVHVIAGLATIDQLEKLNGYKILILGYKNFGRGINFLNNNSTEINAKINALSELLPIMIKDQWFNCLSFDNLALKQLKVKDILSKKEWEEFYMGSDGEATMYVDMVNRKFAKSSTSIERYSLLDNIEDMFSIIKNKKGED